VRGGEKRDGGGHPHWRVSVFVGGKEYIPRNSAGLKFTRYHKKRANTYREEKEKSVVH